MGLRFTTLLHAKTSDSVEIGRHRICAESHKSLSDRMMRERMVRWTKWTVLVMAHEKLSASCMQFRRWEDAYGDSCSKPAERPDGAKIT